jgi:hypothetical protein
VGFFIYFYRDPLLQHFEATVNQMIAPHAFFITRISGGTNFLGLNDSDHLALLRLSHSSRD